MPLLRVSQIFDQQAGSFGCVQYFLDGHAVQDHTLLKSMMVETQYKTIFETIASCVSQHERKWKSTKALITSTWSSSVADWLNCSTRTPQSHEFKFQPDSQWFQSTDIGVVKNKCNREASQLLLCFPLTNSSNECTVYSIPILRARLRGTCILSYLSCFVFTTALTKFSTDGSASSSYIITS